MALTNTLMRFPTAACALWAAAAGVWTADIATMGRAVKRRYFLVQKAKDANIVGILVRPLAPPHLSFLLAWGRKCLNVEDSVTSHLSRRGAERRSVKRGEA